MLEQVSDCADALRIVECFRKRGVRSSALHSLLPKLLARRASNGYDGFIDIKEESEKEAATFTI